MGDVPTIPDLGSVAALISLADLPDILATLDVESLSDAQRLDRLTALERVKGSAAACQARTVVAFAASQRGLHASEGVRAEKQGAGVAMQVGLAMRISRARARRFTGFAHVLGELPHTYDALAAGDTSEYRAYLVAKETIELTLEYRLATDRELAERPGGIGALSDRDAETHTRAIAQRLDPASAVRRNSEAVKQRRVTLRAAPDGMCRLSAVLPCPTASASSRPSSRPPPRRCSTRPTTGPVARSWPTGSSPVSPAAGPSRRSQSDLLRDRRSWSTW